MVRQTGTGEVGLVLRVTDPATLEFLFGNRGRARSDRGRTVRFITSGTRLEESAIEVPLRFHEGPASPLPSNSASRILETR